MCAQTSFADPTGHQKAKALQAVRLSNRMHMHPVVEIAVIESQHDRIFLQRLSRQIGSQLRAAARFVTGALPVTGTPAGGGMSLTADAAPM